MVLWNTKKHIMFGAYLVTVTRLDALAVKSGRKRLQHMWNARSSRNSLSVNTRPGNGNGYCACLACKVSKTRLPHSLVLSCAYVGSYVSSDHLKVLDNVEQWFPKYSHQVPSRKISTILMD